MFQSAFALKDEAVDFGDLSDKQIASSPAHSQTMVAWHQFLNDFDAVFRHISRGCEIKNEQEAKDFAVALAFQYGMPVALAHCLFKYTKIRPLADGPQWQLI